MEIARDSSADILPTRQQMNSKRILIVLVCLQLLAAPVTLVQSLIPPVVGVGLFSVSVDLRYVSAFLLGISFVLPVFLAFAFAWSSYSLPKRVALFLSLAIASTAISVTSIFLKVTWGAMWPRPFPYDECSMMIGLVTFVIAGIAMIPLAARAHLGWTVARAGLDKTISRFESRIEWLALAVIAMLICFSSPFDDVTDGLGYIGALIGIVVGGVLSISIFWMLRDSKAGIFWGLFLGHALLLVALPAICTFLASPNRVPQLMGIEFVFFGIMSGSAILLLQLLLVRRIGCRMQKFGFEKAKVETVEKVVVDPFSD